MDDFLVSLYEEEQEKYAAADLRNLMGTLATDELEEFLNLSKVAVAGPPNPVLPSEEGGKLDKEQKKVDAEVSKMQDQGLPERSTEKTAAVPGALRREIGRLASSTGRGALSGGVLGGAIGGIHGGLSDKSTFLRGAGRGAAIGAGINAGAGLGAQALSRLAGGKVGKHIYEGSFGQIDPVALKAIILDSKNPGRAMARGLGTTAAGLVGGAVLGGKAGSKATEGLKLKHAMINRIQKIAAESSPKIKHEYKTGIIPLSPKRNAAMGAIGGGLLGGGAVGAGLVNNALQGGGKLSRVAKLVAAGVPIATAALGAGSGAALSALKRGKLKSDRRQIDKINKTKVSQGMGGIEDNMTGGAAADSGMETTAAAKAEIVARVMRVTEDAPDHIKLAAARFAGSEIAALERG